MPLGIFVKSSRPIGFLRREIERRVIGRERRNRSPARKPFQSTSWFFLSRSGGDMTYFAPSKFGFSASV